MQRRRTIDSIKPRKFSHHRCGLHRFWWSHERGKSWTHGRYSRIVRDCFFLVGMTLGRQRKLSPEAVAAWAPEGELLPDAGRFMYRVDVTLDEPIRSSILCGPCGHITLRDGSKPSAFSCPKCDRLLWEEE